ncbi:MAG: HD domain-containing protein [Fimbriimonadaceae bacterium]
MAKRTGILSDEMSVLDQAVARAKSQRDDLRLELEKSPSGLEWCRRHTLILDEIWRALFDEMSSRFPMLPPISLVATGGYGRQEVAPYSDLDVALIPGQEDPALDPAIRWLFMQAHEVFGKELNCKLNYVYRLVADVPGLDAVNISNLMDGRVIVGSAQPYRELDAAIWNDFPAAEFILAKIDEREKEMEASHTTPLVVEPNLKLGAGGLRDFHAANWIGAAMGERIGAPGRDVDALLLARNLLHHYTDRFHDLLNRQRREQIAETLGIEAYEYGAQLADAMERLHEEFRHKKHSLRESRFQLTKKSWSVVGELRLDADCPGHEAAVAVNLATRLGLEVDRQTAVNGNECGPECLVAISGGITTIRNMEECGVLETILPELTACRTLMPRDTAHRYTVYEHTIVALEHLEDLDPNSPLGEIKEAVTELEALRLAILLHDVGKVDDSRPHSEVGAEMAIQVCRRWKIDARRSRIVTWLVQEHLTMAKFLRMRDVFHADTAAEFAKIVETEEKLQLLTILTACDVKAVSPELWTPVQETLLLELYARTRAIIQSRYGDEPDAASLRDRIRRRLSKEEVPAEQMQEFLASLPVHYLLTTDPDTAKGHFSLVQKANQGEVAVLFTDFKDLGITDITVCCHDTPGLLNRILGVLYALNFSMLGFGLRRFRRIHRWRWIRLRWLIAEGL